MGETVDKVEVDGGKAEVAHPAEHLLGHFTRLDSMHGLLDLRVEILNAEGGAVESNFTKGCDMVAVQPARVYFDTGFEVVGKSEVAMNDFTELADFIRVEKRWRAATPVKLDGFAAWIEQRGHLGHFLAQVLDVSHSLAVIQRDDSGAAAVPTQSFAKGDVEIERQVALGAIVFQDALGEGGPLERFGEFGRRRVGGIARPRHVVFLDEVEVDFQHAHRPAARISGSPRCAPFRRGWRYFPA